MLFKRIIGQLTARLNEIGAKGLIVHASKEVSEHDYLADSPLPALDLYPVMSAYEQEHGVQLYYADGVHWNEKGHRLIADDLKKVIEHYRVSATLQVAMALD
jgi:lysophospholipase L1-like esterase